MAEHSVFGGSSSPRWLTCSASVGLCASLPPVAPSVWAAEGTQAHEYAAWALENAARPQGISDEMWKHVRAYCSEVWDAQGLHRGEKNVRLVEQKFVLDLPSAEKGEVFGSNDALVYNPAKRLLTIFDLKYGAGKSVSAVENKQLMFYALGALFENPSWIVETVKLVIYQPRAWDVETNGAFREWEFSVNHVLEFADELDQGIQRAKNNPTFVVSDECGWCPAAAHCKAFQSHALAKAGTAFSEVNLNTVNALPQPQTADDAQLSNMLEAIPLLEEWISAVRERAQRAMEAGASVPGWKLVAKQARRKWAAPPEDVAGYLSSAYGVPYEELMPPSLVTITEAESLLGQFVKDKKVKTAAKLDMTLKFTIKESSGVKMVPASDPGDAVTPGYAFSEATLSS